LFFLAAVYLALKSLVYYRTNKGLRGLFAISSLIPSLRCKRFRRAFRPLEALFAFWLRKNWGERNTDGSTFLRPPQFSRGQKSEKCIERAESLAETLATQAI